LAHNKKIKRYIQGFLHAQYTQHYQLLIKFIWNFDQSLKFTFITGSLITAGRDYLDSWQY